MSKQYAEICGVTEQEIRDNIDTQVGEMAEANGLTKDECYGRLKKQYALPFAHDPRKLYKIGVNFSSETRRIESWRAVER